MLKAIVIEDEPHVRKELVLFTPWEKAHLIFAGEAENGKKGLALIQKVNPDIVLTDIQMPELDGLSMIKEFKIIPHKKEPEWIILSGYTEFEYARTAMKMGIQEYLLKPVEEEQLFAALLRCSDRIAKKNEFSRIKNIVQKSNNDSLHFFNEYHTIENKNPIENERHHYVSKAVELIRAKYILGITIEEAASILGISAGHLSRLFKKETGYTFVDYLLYIRVSRAAELLQKGECKVYEIADLVGYADARYFSQVFKKVTGYTPKEFSSL